MKENLYLNINKSSLANPAQYAMKVETVSTWDGFFIGSATIQIKFYLHCLLGVHVHIHTCAQC